MHSNQQGDALYSFYMNAVILLLTSQLLSQSYVSRVVKTCLIGL